MQAGCDGMRVRWGWLALVLATMVFVGAGSCAGQGSAGGSGAGGSGAGGSGAGGSGAGEDFTGVQVREIHPAALPSPFPLDVKSGSEHGYESQELEYRTPEAMTAADRALVDRTKEEIWRRAKRQGFRLGVDRGQGTGDDAGAGWGYEQAVCPAFPGHMVLEFSRYLASGVRPGRVRDGGDLSLFSVVIPREGEAGHVRVIPGRRRGYSLFTPVASNALTLNDFNHMVGEEPGGLSPDWLTLGLCYTAIASGHVRAALEAVVPEQELFPLAMPAKLSVSGKGGAEVRFVDDAPGARSMAWEWVLMFDQKGHLLKVRHGDVPRLAERPVAGAASEVEGRPIPSKR